ncbi:type I-E CRISPR-associated protein Cas6/Cse3/CasE [Streptococcus ratti]|uniref:Type I-E CRISPR-associated protein Cas6/Cse3/CasE n=1 Tax=Streptococcus ratti TaxID=1341 RepID=A0A7X9QH09_STRRT|nr:type I-E CRISPR-associated protein Cas6/Cse3/CasE [Streptococcus ratti]NMD49269.1 type I-E CRISPR-associated protein Cas6/Cse3/CasE [Streptococcus ratti]
MHISRVEIDHTNRRKIKDLTHVDAYHGWVESSFPAEIEKSIRTRKLWRVDTIQGRNYLLVVSQGKPDLSLLEKYGVSGSAQTKPYDPFLENLKPGDSFQFRVVLNPVISLSNRDHSKRGAVKPHVTVEHQIQYLMDRSEKNGFSLHEGDFSVVERGYEVLKKSTVKPVRLVKAVYEGVLTITDVELFRKVLTDGIGKKKAYGFGLMTVIPMGK